MKKALFLLFNHSLTTAQKEAAEKGLGATRIISPPPAVQQIWRDIPPLEPAIDKYLKPIREWLRQDAAPGDYVLIQGDFGACYLMVTFAFDNRLIPVYSTTRREAHEKEQADGSIILVHNFNHTIYRKYER